MRGSSNIPTNYEVSHHLLYSVYHPNTCVRSEQHLASVGWSRSCFGVICRLKAFFPRDGQPSSRHGTPHTKTSMVSLPRPSRIKTGPSTVKRRPSTVKRHLFGAAGGPNGRSGLCASYSKCCNRGGNRSCTPVGDGTVRDTT